MCEKRIEKAALGVFWRFESIFSLLCRKVAVELLFFPLIYICSVLITS